MEPSPRRVRDPARRDQLLDAALRHFAANGFRGASLAAIARDVGISEPGLLHHFSSKRQLLFDVLAHHETRVMRLIQSVDDAGGTFADQMRAIAAAHEADPAFIRLFTVLAAESVESGHPAHEWFRDRYRSIRAGMAARIAEDQAAGELAADLEPERVARLLIAVFDGLELQFLLEHEEAGISAPLDLVLGRLRPT
jgi:AcrR family transcriptional regulator